MATMVSAASATMSTLVTEVDSWRTKLADLDPTLLSGDECATLVSSLAALRKACAAAVALVAARAASCGAHRRRGYIEAADWIASETGESSVEAKRELETMATLAANGCAATKTALAGGELSFRQATEVAKTAAACPGSEIEILDVARTRTLRVLQEKARKRRLEAVDADELARRQHAERRFRQWRDDEGMVRISGALPPIDGLRFMALLDVETERIRRAARRGGDEETWEAYAADALMSLGGRIDGAPRAAGPRTEVVLVADIRSYVRGHAHWGEVCHVIGGGPVPVSAVREAVEGGAFVKGVVHDGERVQLVKHYGRHIKAELRTALELGPPPEFDGKQCGCGCGKRYKLQFDHVDPFANNGPTSLANLNPLTPIEHADKTARDLRAGRLGRAPLSNAVPAGRAPP